MKLGKPKHEQSTKNYFAFKKDQNTFILRILPPMGELADAGKWSIYHRVEFGHVDSDGRMKPFLSPRVVNYNGMVEVESESHTRRETLKAQMEAAKAAGNKAIQEQCNNMLRKYNQDAKHYMNVVDLQGNVGLFKIGHRGFQSLKAEIDRIRSTDGIDPVDVETGRFFVFNRTGKGRDTVYTVQEYKQKQEMVGPNGEKVVADVSYTHALDEGLISKLETDAFELNKVYPSISAEEESRIIHEGATAVDEILGKKKEDSKPANPASTTSEASSGNSAQAAESAPTQSYQTAPSQEEPEASGSAQTASPSETTQVGGETVNTETGEILTQQPAASAPASEIANMSEEDFFNKIKQGNF